jgi:hypothetical protein
LRYTPSPSRNGQFAYFWTDASQGVLTKRYHRMIRKLKYKKEKADTVGESGTLEFACTYSVSTHIYWKNFIWNMEEMNE